jgi:hypothetical protein
MDPPRGVFEALLEECGRFLDVRASDPAIQTWRKSLRQLEIDGNDAFTTRNQQKWSMTNDSLLLVQDRLTSTSSSAAVDETPPAPYIKDALKQEVERLRSELRAAHMQVQTYPAYTCLQAKVEAECDAIETVLDAVEAAIDKVNDNLEPRHGLAQCQLAVRPLAELPGRIQDIVGRGIDGPVKIRMPREASNEADGRHVGSDAPRPVRREALAPIAVTDRVHFSVAAPCEVQVGSSFLVELWAHLESQRAEVIERVQQANPRVEPQVRSVGPIPVTRGTILIAAVEIEGFEIPEHQETILWEGDIGSASFAVTVPTGIPEGQRAGHVTMFKDGARLARVVFVITVGARTDYAPAPQWELRYRTAFASYASEDREAVLMRVQGINIGAPDMNIFVDVVSLRPGQDWEKELWTRIPENDVFFLFWSKHAAESEWVAREWKCALATRGTDFIAPVMLAPPDVAPPPAELSRLHFNDSWLAYISASARSDSGG